MNPTVRYGWRWFAALLLAVSMLLPAVGSPPSAAAHAELITSQPGNGERVAALPPTVELRYSEGVQLAEVTVMDAQGVRIDRGSYTVDPTDRTHVTVPLGAAGEGVYTVNWHVLSVDGHTTIGAFYFLVGNQPLTREVFLQLTAGGAPAPAGPSPWEIGRAHV